MKQDMPPQPPETGSPGPDPVSGCTPESDAGHWRRCRAMHRNGGQERHMRARRLCRRGNGQMSGGRTAASGRAQSTASLHPQGIPLRRGTEPAVPPVRRGAPCFRPGRDLRPGSTRGICCGLAGCSHTGPATWITAASALRGRGTGGLFPLVASGRRSFPLELIPAGPGLRSPGDSFTRLPSGFCPLRNGSRPSGWFRMSVFYPKQQDITLVLPEQVRYHKRSPPRGAKPSPLSHPQGH